MRLAARSASRACAEIRLAAGDLDGARAASDELATGRGRAGLGVLGAIADHTRGAIDLAAGDADAALPALRRAFRVWDELGRPTRRPACGRCSARPCRRSATRTPRAWSSSPAPCSRRWAPDAGACRCARRRAVRRGRGGLTARELEVLRLLAAGRTNKAIAAELVLSDRTVDRHVSNIFAKLGVASRAAATAYAYEHGLAG